VVERFQRDTAEIRRARWFVRQTLAGWGFDDQVPGLDIGVSELVTNAIVHGRGLVELGVIADGETIRVEVTNEGVGRVDLRAGRDPAAIGGRGLRLVDHEADSWGTSGDGQRTVVWLEKRVDTTRQRDRDRDATG
jgi:anti-sigma regulatory factor (Ser/Thr protein kinase)